jgi:putative transposase
MYRWRKLSNDDQETLLEWRKRLERPWHSPPHFKEGPADYHLTAACYEHAEILGHSPERMGSFCEDLLAKLKEATAEVHSWCVLPNHYHLLVRVAELRPVLSALGRLHGRTSFIWNGEEGLRGRRVWCAPADRLIRSEAHFHATVNYIHHNPVKHGWVEHWQDWPFSSAASWLTAFGREEALHRWKAYPILNYGAGWDD